MAAVIPLGQASSGNSATVALSTPSAGNSGVSIGAANPGNSVIPITPVSTPKAAATTTSTPAATPGSSASPVDQAKINTLVALGTSAAQSGAQGTTSNLAGSLGEQGQNLSNEIQTGQNNINLARTQIGTTQINTIKQLMSTIKDGLQGTGVQLGNSNALDSSAADAAARAYANYGNVGTNAANNTAATGQEGQDVAQNNLDLTSSTGLASIKAARDSAIGQIQANAASALDSLATSITYLGGDPNSVQVQKMQAQIVANAQNELDQVDQNIQGLISGGVQPLNPNQVQGAAETASNAGVTPSSGNQYTTTNLPANSAIATPQTTLGGAQTSLIPLAVGSSKNQNQP